MEQVYVLENANVADIESEIISDEVIDSHFPEIGKSLHQDSWHVLAPLQLWFEKIRHRRITKLPILQNYEEYFFDKYNAKITRKILGRSNIMQTIEFDKLIEDFNKQAPNEELTGEQRISLVEKLFSGIEKLLHIKVEGKIIDYQMLPDFKTSELAENQEIYINN